MERNGVHRVKNWNTQSMFCPRISKKFFHIRIDVLASEDLDDIQRMSRCILIATYSNGLWIVVRLLIHMRSEHWCLDEYPRDL